MRIIILLIEIVYNAKNKYNKRSENKINAFEYLNNVLFKVRMLMNINSKTMRI